MNWHQKGVEAGKKEGWMNLEETLGEDLERHPEYARDAGELVQSGIDSWEETGHFETLYGQPMLDAAREESPEGEDWIDTYQDNKSAFWEGYLEGRKAKGVDIYKIAQKLIDKKHKPVVHRVGKAHRTHRKTTAQTTIGSIRR